MLKASQKKKFIVGFSGIYVKARISTKPSDYFPLNIFVIAPILHDLSHCPFNAYELVKSCIPLFGWENTM